MEFGICKCGTLDYRVLSLLDVAMAVLRMDAAMKQELNLLLLNIA
jgi:hypothetical protein